MPPPAASLRLLFATPLYEADLARDYGLGAGRFEAFNAELAQACRMLAAEDRAGRAWSRAHGYGGYTSYASLDDLPTRATAFAELKRRLDRHAAAFAVSAGFDLQGGRLRLDSLWANLLRPGAAHGGHIHPHSAVSGTLYVEVPPPAKNAPPGAGAIRFEDPRLPLMMAAPPRAADAPEAARAFVEVHPRPGLLLLWESWLRHEVRPHAGRGDRISLSFNYAWG